MYIAKSTYKMQFYGSMGSTYPVKVWQTGHHLGANSSSGSSFRIGYGLLIACYLGSGKTSTSVSCVSMKFGINSSPSYGIPGGASGMD
jgi:hypothetical protein